MEKIGSILRPQPSVGGEFFAAAVVATANDWLQQVLHLSPLDASAKSVRHGTLMIETEHGAVAGLIVRRTDDLIEYVNKTIERQFRKPNAVAKVATRRR